MLRIIKDKETKEEQKIIIKESKKLTLNELKKKLGKEYMNTYFITSDNLKLKKKKKVTLQ